MQVHYLTWETLTTVTIESGHLYSIELHPELLLASDQLVAIYLSDQENAATQFDQIKSKISKLVASIGLADVSQDPELNDLLVEIDWIIEEPVHDESDYLEAQLKAYVYLISARLAYLRLSGKFAVQWLDARDIVVTDEAWKQATVNIELSRKRLETLSPKFSYITTHGIGSSSDNQNTLTAQPRSWDLLVLDALV